MDHSDEFESDEFENRKRDHIRCSLQEESQAGDDGDWDRLALIPEALPDLDFQAIHLETQSLGSTWRSPFFISSMTAGHSEALNWNSILAEAAQEKGWLMGVGSQRRELEDSTAHREWIELRRRFPGVNLASNIGITQLIQTPMSRIQSLIESTQSVALFVHLNALQECLQPEGTPHFQGSIKAVAEAVASLSVPVVVKEVGMGIAPPTLQILKDLGVAAVDVSGRGGTHWGRVEGLRAPKNSRQARAAQVFQNWGLTTPRALYQLSQGPAIVESSDGKRKANLELWASGGVRDGLKATKCVALGAQRIGVARPILLAAQQGLEATVDFMNQVEFELKVGLMCSGCQNLEELRRRKGWVWKDK